MSVDTDAKLRKQYDNGEITAEEFIEKLFASETADNRRRKIVEKNRKLRNRRKE
ncbi:hypothetical protein [Alteribacter populi]|uniref:hypothetical protein n=1 Tax=Alteribacter populi TaxID=2011011 RepID=UPI0012FF89C2|nr:hypothetical protein [Alteribacter populi]